LPQYYSTIQTGDINGDGRAELLARNASVMEAWRFDGTGWTQLPTGPGWNDAVGWNLPQYYSTIQTGDINGDGSAELLGRDALGLVTYQFNRFQTNAWDLLPGPGIQFVIGELPGTAGKSTSAPAAIAHNDGSLDLVVRGYDQALWHTHYNGTTWGKWNNNGGLLLSSPAATSRASGELDVFAVGVDNRIYQNNWDGTTWNGWSLVNCGGSFPEIERVIPPPKSLPQQWRRAAAASSICFAVARIIPCFGAIPMTALTGVRGKI